jgi:hypothetical protein
MAKKQAVPDAFKKKRGRPPKDAPIDFLKGRIEAVLGALESPVDLEELALEIYNRLGGTRGYAEKLMVAYNLTRPGSAENARMFDLITDLFKRASDKRMGKDIDKMTDAELESVALDLARKSGVSGLPVTDWVDHVCI